MATGMAPGASDLSGGHQTSDHCIPQALQSSDEALGGEWGACSGVSSLPGAGVEDSILWWTLDSEQASLSSSGIGPGPAVMCLQGRGPL